MSNFKEYLRESLNEQFNKVEPDHGKVSSRIVRQKSEYSPVRDGEGPTPKQVCEWLIAVWDSMGCVGRGDDTDTDNFDCDLWEQLMEMHNCR